MELSHIPEGVILTQHKCTKDLLKASGQDHFKKVVSPLPSNIKMSASNGVLLDDPSLYRSIIGNFISSLIQDLIYHIPFKF